MTPASAEAIAQLLDDVAWPLHGRSGQLDLLLMLYVAADESHDEKRQHVLTMAGILGPKMSWNYWWVAWNKALADEGVNVFHAVHCEQGNGEFRGWSRDRRAAFQRRLIEITIDARWPLSGYSVSLPIPAHASLRSRFRKLITFDKGSSVNGPLDDPWFLALQLLPVTVGEDPNIVALPPDERVGFVFDQHHLGARGRAIYLGVIRPAKYKDRFAGISFQDKAKWVPLQAADLLAYETFRHFHEHVSLGRPERWQYTMLSSVVRVAAFPTAETLQEMIAKAEAIPRKER